MAAAGIHPRSKSAWAMASLAAFNPLTVEQDQGVLGVHAANADTTRRPNHYAGQRHAGRSSDGVAKVKNGPALELLAGDYVDGGGCVTGKTVGGSGCDHDGVQVGNACTRGSRGKQQVDSKGQRLRREDTT